MKIGVIGLGYVGLPLLIEFSKKYKVIGYDKNNKRINDLKKNEDINNDLNKKQFNLIKRIDITKKITDLKDCNIYIVTVPTPVNKKNQPDLIALEEACISISTILKSKDIVIFESTVYPGLTEDLCVKWLKTNNNLIYNKDFFCGYSPERINPGDKTKTLTKIKKITAGSNFKTANIVDKLYKSIINAGTYKASSIKVAEAAKIIENCQRDVNIAFVNELQNIFDNMQLNTNEILEAAATKWNFLNFKPGLVGGHCVSVDPYYLIHKSNKNHYSPNLLITARKINESAPKKIFDKVKFLLKNDKNKKILILGFSFKENCNDIRNTKVFNIYQSLSKNFKKVEIYDPIVNIKEVKKLYNIKLNSKIKKNYYDLVIITVKHKIFKKFSKKEIKKFLKGDKIILDYINLYG
tara:strand:+ start:110 stop:1333 length:1224 start_codon:yes stop_codon:yes gene_type:complete